jgi:cytochrome c oxidase subunit III
MSEPGPIITSLPRVPRGGSVAAAGMALLVAIELTVVSSLVISYFYLRVNSAFWPPPGVELPEVLLGALEAGLLLASTVPMRLGTRAWASERPRPLRWLLPVSLGLLAASLVLKGMELAKLDYSLNSHAYGSIVWTLHGYSALHAVALITALSVLWLMAVRGHLDMQRGAAVEALALYTYFVGASGLLVFATLSLSPHLL